MKLLKRTILALLLLTAAFMSYAFYTTRNSVNMTTRQKILKAAYPAIMWFSKIANGKNAVAENNSAQPLVDFYSLTAKTIDGGTFNFSTLKGKKVLLVNTASDCGYTSQYEELEKLHEQYKTQLEIIAFPANDFKEQEKGEDAAIENFCKKNYGITFPLMSKSVVIKSASQHAVFKWLSDPAFNGWNDRQPTWNFCKYLVDENGRLTGFFSNSISPLSPELTSAIERK